MQVKLKDALLAALCSFLFAFAIGMLFPIRASAEEMNTVYEAEVASMETLEEAGSAECDHACLIIAGFIGVGGLANAVISLFFLIYGCKKEEKVKEGIVVLRQSAEAVERLRQKYPPGIRLRMIHMEAPNPVEYGEEGTVTFVDEMGVVHADWESGRHMGVIPSLDRFEVRERNK